MALLRSKGKRSGHQSSLTLLQRFRHQFISGTVRNIIMCGPRQTSKGLASLKCCTHTLIRCSLIAYRCLHPSGQSVFSFILFCYSIEDLVGIKEHINHFNVDFSVINIDFIHGGLNNSRTLIAAEWNIFMTCCSNVVK